VFGQNKARGTKEGSEMRTRSAMNKETKAKRQSINLSGTRGGEYALRRRGGPVAAVVVMDSRRRLSEGMRSKGSLRGSLFPGWGRTTMPFHFCAGPVTYAYGAMPCRIED